MSEEKEIKSYLWRLAACYFIFPRKLRRKRQSELGHEMMSNHQFMEMISSIIKNSDRQTLSSSAERQMEPILVTQYLDRLCKELSDVPKDERPQIRAEVCTHLLAIINAEEIKGEPEQDAITASLERFGDAQIIGRELNRQWRQAKVKKLPLKSRIIIKAVSNSLYAVSIAALVIINGLKMTIPTSCLWALLVCSGILGGYIAKEVEKRVKGDNYSKQNKLAKIANSMRQETSPALTNVTLKFAASTLILLNFIAYMSTVLLVWAAYAIVNMFWKPTTLTTERDILILLFSWAFGEFLSEARNTLNVKPQI